MSCIKIPTGSPPGSFALAAGLLVGLLCLPAGLKGQAGGGTDPVGDSIAPASVVGSGVEATTPSGPPVGIILGLGWGMRSDDCTGCGDPENLSSFGVHLSLTKPLVAGLGVGLDISGWQRGHPAPAGATRPDEEPDPTALPSLTNRLGNASVVFSYRTGPLYLRGGVGVALAWADVVEDDGGTGPGVIRTASGKGVGFTGGGGLLLPLSGNLGLAFYANWNYGRYDLTSPTTVVARDAAHEVLELGVGVAFR